MIELDLIVYINVDLNAYHLNTLNQVSGTRVRVVLTCDDLYYKQHLFKNSILLNF